MAVPEREITVKILEEVISKEVGRLHGYGAVKDLVALSMKLVDHGVKAVVAVSIVIDAFEYGRAEYQ